MEAIHILVNPASAGGRGRALLPRLVHALDEASLGPKVAGILETEHPGHARELVRSQVFSGRGGPLVVVGGDGTIHEVANALLDAGRQDIPILPLPTGTGNDFHRMLHAGSGVDDVVAVLQRGVVRRFEVGRARWNGRHRWFVNLLGIGIDVEILRRRHRFRLLPGLLQYLAALPPALMALGHPKLEVRLGNGDGEGETLRAETLLAAITVGPSVGGGFLLSPKASPEDGMLDLFLVGRLGLLEVIRYLPGVLRGTHRDGDPIRLRTLRSARIRTTDDRPFRFEMDGELMDVETSRLDVELHPGALPVLDLPCADGSAIPGGGT